MKMGVGWNAETCECVARGGCWNVCSTCMSMGALGMLYSMICRQIAINFGHIDCAEYITSKW
jgi:hypothetical protein